jgi:late competence protein required for DNA uptake (superfamily II DNA/RNA helicase)
MSHLYIINYITPAIQMQICAQATEPSYTLICSECIFLSRVMNMSTLHYNPHRVTDKHFCLFKPHSHFPVTEHKA